MDYGLWIMDYGLWIMDYGLWIIIMYQILAHSKRGFFYAPSKCNIVTVLHLCPTFVAKQKKSLSSKPLFGFTSLTNVVS